MNVNLFDGDRWKWKSLEDYIAYKDMHDFVKNNQAMETHNNSMEYMVIDPELHDHDTEQVLRSNKVNNIINSLDHFAAQTLVSLCTTYEVAAKDFFKNLFITHPNFMHEYVGEGTNKGRVKLNDLISSGGYEEFIEITADKSSNLASKGKYGEVLIRASKLCKSTISLEMVNDINALQTIRNKIVHEKNVKHFTLEDVGKAQTDVSSVIEMFCEFALKKDVPGSYTCIQPQTFVMKSAALLKI